ncbi:MAG: hypothetical protein Kow0063_08260 [Anaerolineae bacterium]
MLSLYHYVIIISHPVMHVNSPNCLKEVLPYQTVKEAEYHFYLSQCYPFGNTFHRGNTGNSQHFYFVV